MPLADSEVVVGRQILGAMGSQMGPELRVGATQTPRALGPPSTTTTLLGKALHPSESIQGPGK